MYSGCSILIIITQVLSNSSLFSGVSLSRLNKKAGVREEKKAEGRREAVEGGRERILNVLASIMLLKNSYIGLKTH